MKQIFYWSVFLTLFSFSAFSEQIKDNKEHLTFVIVHGVSGGGWDWKEVSNILSQKGHTVYRPTLTGLGERYHLSTTDINLTTHINDIVNLFRFEELDDVVLVGHSYGGMVITGVMDKFPERILHVTFLDAVVPEDGMSLMTEFPLTPEHKVINERVHFSWIDPNSPFPRDVEHPINTLIEPVSYKNPLAKSLDVTYVAFIPENMTTVERAKDPSWARAVSRNWTIRTFDGDHVVYRIKPKEFANMLEQTAWDTNLN